MECSLHPQELTAVQEKTNQLQFSPSAVAELVQSVWDIQREGAPEPAQGHLHFLCGGTRSSISAGSKPGNSGEQSCFHKELEGTWPRMGVTGADGRAQSR